MSRKLDSNKYVSLSRERQSLQAEDSPNISEEEATADEEGSTTHTSSNDAQEEESNSDSDTEIEGTKSLFHMHMPGIMSSEELEAQMDLSEWPLLIRHQVVQMKASYTALLTLTSLY